MDIQLIIFDFGGVLINLDRQACVDRYLQLGISNVNELLDNYVQSGVFLAFEKGELTLDEFHNEIRKISGTYIADCDIDDAFKAFLLDIPKVKMDKVRQLHQAYRTVVLSNTNELHFPMDTGKLVVGDYTITDYFDHCYLSYQMHKSKPDEAIFRELLKNENIKPEKCLFIDDGEQNIEVAKRLGFNCLWAKEGQWLDEIDNLLKS